MIKKPLCKLFSHQLGEWEYVADSSCEQVRVCRRCGYEERHNAPHQFGLGKYPPGSCVFVQKCKRCGHEKKLEPRPWVDDDHLFGEWKYKAPGSCEQIRICKRCGLKREREEHESLVFVSSVREDIPAPVDYDVYVLIEKYKCGRCGKEVTKREEHL